MTIDRKKKEHNSLDQNNGNIDNSINNKMCERLHDLCTGRQDDKQNDYVKWLRSRQTKF